MFIICLLQKILLIPCVIIWLLKLGPFPLSALLGNLLEMQILCFHLTHPVSDLLNQKLWECDPVTSFIILQMILTILKFETIHPDSLVNTKRENDGEYSRNLGLNKGTKNVVATRKCRSIYMATIGISRHMTGYAYNFFLECGRVQNLKPDYSGVRRFKIFREQGMSLLEIFRLLSLVYRAL